MLFDTFSGIWSTDSLKKIIALGIVKLDNIDKLHACYLTMKEDPSVFVKPDAVPEDKPVKEKTPQLILDEDYKEFSFAPEKLLQSFVDDKMKL